ncbi:hypothetical protein [Vulcanisaeta sp. JCM 16161]|uniref:hypothetical protein n=1 Tax=Vulcanisaeta sp. JCM 16161 TaxID=1295372 RepID=UPI0006D07D24|nr:hypothetical protein [Vulcanisaeta sp. JCM 16161]
MRILAASLLIASALLSLGNTALFSVLVITAVITWLYWSKSPIPLSLAIIALTSLVTPPMDMALTSISTVLIDNALKTGNERPWWFYAAPLSASILLAIILRQFYIAASLSIPLLYILAISLINVIRFYTITIELRPGRELRVDAGSELAYSLTVLTRPRVRALMEVRAPKGLRVNPARLYMNGEASIKAIAGITLAVLRGRESH